MTHLRRGDEDLHYDTGEHRSTPPTTNGWALGNYERRIVRHLIAHERQALIDDAKSLDVLATECRELDKWEPYHASRERRFKAVAATGEWPAYACERCQRRGFFHVGSASCCQSYGHHVGDFCLHCGNDER